MKTHGTYMVEDINRAIALMTVGFPATLHQTRYKPDGAPVVAFSFSERNIENPSVTANNLIAKYEAGTLPAEDPFRIALAAIVERHSWLDFLHRATGWHRGFAYPYRLQPGGQYQWTTPENGIVRTPHMHKAIGFHLLGWKLAGIEGNGDKRSMYIFDRHTDDGADLLPLMMSLNSGDLAARLTNHPLVVACNALHNVTLTLDMIRHGTVLHYVKAGRRHVYYREHDADNVRQRVARFLGAKK
jgi:hypothetical protein